MLSVQSKHTRYKVKYRISTVYSSVEYTVLVVECLWIEARLKIHNTHSDAQSAQERLCEWIIKNPRQHGGGYLQVVVRF